MLQDLILTAVNEGIKNLLALKNKIIKEQKKSPSFLMIITCHILQGLNYEAAFYINVGVQIFFFMSGYLYGKKEIDNPKKFYKNRIKRILMPLSMLVIIIIIFERIISNIKYTFPKLKKPVLSDILEVTGPELVADSISFS